MPINYLPIVREYTLISTYFHLLFLFFFFQKLGSSIRNHLEISRIEKITHQLFTIMLEQSVNRSFGEKFFEKNQKQMDINNWCNLSALLF